MNAIEAPVKPTLPTLEEIRAKLLGGDPQSVAFAVKVLYDRQTADEQDQHATRERNGVGFNGTDANYGTSLHDWMMRWVDGASNRYHTRLGVYVRHPLTPKQCQAAGKMLAKYAKQIQEEIRLRMVARGLLEEE